MYDYVHGKADWLAAGLPTEGTNAERPTASDVARSDVPTCRLDEPVDEVRARVAEAGWDTCVVVNDDDRVVFGILRARELAKPSDEPIERAMQPGPSTFRPNVSIEEMAAFMSKHDLVNSPITTSDGRLVGLLRKDDAVRVAMQLHGHHHDGDDDDAG